VSNTIAHEMRTPMSRILAALRMAELPGASELQVRQANRTAICELEAVTVVFDKLLLIAEAESGTRRRAFERIELDQITRDVADLYTAVADEQGASLVDRSGHHLAVLGDRDLLAGAVANLVENALKYAASGGVIRVGAQREGDAILLTVEDNGAGVPAHLLKHLGTRFYRLDRSLPGFGLGLANVLAVAKLHGGSVSFEDAGPGLSVRLRLPALTH
jgi:signal transduction histidine kinase